eukprot:jgi/Picsp_1/2614/NSC_00844-R1_k(+) efflux antiporter chloroplastic-like
MGLDTKTVPSGMLIPIILGFITKVRQKPLPYWLGRSNLGACQWQKLDKTFMSLSRGRERSLVCPSELKLRFRASLVRHLIGRRTCGQVHRSMGLQGCPGNLHATCLRVTQRLGRRLQCSPGQSDRVSPSGEIPNTSEDANGSNGNEIIEQIDDEDMSENPELGPLKEAVQRAHERRKEATGIREALEAEAQEVAQLAVNAETNMCEIKDAVEKVESELKEANESFEALASAVAKLHAQLVSEEESQSLELSQDYLETAESATSYDDEEAMSLDDVKEDLSALKSLEEMLRDRTEQLQEAEMLRGELEKKLEEMTVKFQSAEESYKKADGIAAAAMEAAEEAVRDEMDYITVANETESALLKAIDDLKYFDDSSEKREEQFDKKSKANVEETAKEQSVESAAGVSQSATAKPAEKKEAAITPVDAEESVIALSKTQALIYLMKRSWMKNRSLILAATCVALFGSLLMSHEPFALAVRSKISILGGKLTQISNVAMAILAKVPLPHVHESEAGILETIWLLLASVITVPLVCKLPGGSPVLGFLAGGALIGPYALGIIQDVESIRHLAELGVVFLLFNIGLELSFDRLRSMQKFVFGMGTAQVALTLAAVACVALMFVGPSLGGPGAVILGGGLALSTTAIGMQVLQDRGETGSRHGRAAFSVLLLQDLAVVVLLMLIPLLAPGTDGAAGAEGLIKIAKAIGFASIKAVVCMASIIVAGRTLLRPLYKRVADTKNSEIFAALTLLVVLGTSLITQVAGLSLALGAFLAGLLLAETEFHIQVESDIAPYKGLLMGLFFMTVGMEISAGLLIAKFKTVAAAITMLIAGKVAIMTAVGQAFGLSMVQSFRSGLLLSPGGEFAFVLYGEAVSRGIFGAALAKELYLVVALSMALTPFLAEFGGKVGKLLEKRDMKALSPKDGELIGMQGHVIISGFGRVGQLIAQMLSEDLIPFVALDTNAERVQQGKANDLPVYFGDAGSPAVLHSIGAENAACAVITLDTPSSNYRSVWAMHKHFPHVKTFCRAHDIEAGRMLERAGATAVVPEVLEPSLQLGAAILSELNIPENDVAETVRNFRKNHLSEFQMSTPTSVSSLGYGQSRDVEDDDSLLSERQEVAENASATS